MTSLGVLPGTPDSYAVKDGKLYALKLKTPGGRLAVRQRRTLMALRDAGAMSTPAHGLDQALRVLEGWALPRGQAT